MSEAGLPEPAAMEAVEESAPSTIDDCEVTETNKREAVDSNVGKAANKKQKVVEEPVTERKNQIMSAEEESKYKSKIKYDEVRFT